jgi:hypothetical protein
MTGRDGNSSPGEPPDIKPPVNRSTSAPQGKTTINQEPQVAKIAFVVTDALREKARYLAGSRRSSGRHRQDHRLRRQDPAQAFPR